MDEITSFTNTERDAAFLASPTFLSALGPVAALMVDRFMEPKNHYQSSWKPLYKSTTERVKAAIQEGSVGAIIDEVWLTPSNGVCNVGQGGLGRETVDSLREEFKALTLEIAADSSPEKYQEVLLRMTKWRDEKLTKKLPRLLIGRAFATLHPDVYHTLVAPHMQDRVAQWLSENTGFSIPEGNWANKAQALVKHLNALAPFSDKPPERNMFPWFVFEHLRYKTRVVPFKAGHTKRSENAYVDLPATQRQVWLRHNRLQTELFRLLDNEFKGCVGTEQSSGSNGYADALVRFNDDRCFLYEIKVAPTAARAVREALGQLLEYAYRPKSLEPEKMVIVAEPDLDAVTAQFIQRLNTEFGLTLEYLQVTLPDDDEPSGISHPV
ncbi:hypothetical protein [Pseudomonas sp. FH1]|uniref:hypothetical protein n=1 Tax=Pseudomonas sp. FH1 TaxID=1284392 RepID=UPI0003DDB3A6|nr:hypothetical protein [Pseudomonas sp. FH1]ETK22485.1 hypothetical protein H096_15283 [Pseudomonas sp. FH1]